YHSGARDGSPAKAATSSRGRAMEISVRTSTGMRRAYTLRGVKRNRSARAEGAIAVGFVLATLAACDTRIGVGEVVYGTGGGGAGEAGDDATLEAAARDATDATDATDARDDARDAGNAGDMDAAAHDDPDAPDADAPESAADDAPSDAPPDADARPHPAVED